MIAGNYTFTVEVPRQLRDREMESVDHAVDILRGIRGVTVTGWCDEEDD